MSVDNTVHCDWCDEDITYTDYERDYRLNLRDVHKAHRGGVVFAMGFDPTYGSLDFCNSSCLKEYLVEH